MNFIQFLETSTKINFFPIQVICSKTAMVAIASFIMFKMQYNYPSAKTLGLTTSLACFTYLSEKQIGDRTNFWFSKPQHFDREARSFIGLCAIPFLMLKNLTNHSFQQTSAESIQKPWDASTLKSSIILTMLAPFAEEILFRGFLKERILDSLLFFNHGIYKIETRRALFIANIAQAALFGLAHINQENKTRHKIALFIATGGVGLFQGFAQDTEKSLINCILYHSFNNTIFFLKNRFF